MSEHEHEIEAGIFDGELLDQHEFLLKRFLVNYANVSLYFSNFTTRINEDLKKYARKVNGTQKFLFFLFKTSKAEQGKNKDLN